MTASEPLVALIGYGAIGRALTSHLRAGGGCRLGILSRQPMDFPGDVHPFDTIDALLASRPSLAVEAAGHSAVHDYGPALLEAGISFVIASTGALAEPELLRRLSQCAAAGRARLVISTGAIGGLDYLAAISLEAGSRVRYTTRKPPAAWRDELRALGQDPDALAEAITLFEGAADEAARRYPRNLNAGLAVALTVGLSRTQVRVIADPQALGNTHEIEAEGPAGNASMRFVNTPSPDNPKTSALTALSLAAAVRRQLNSALI